MKVYLKVLIIAAIVAFFIFLVFYAETNPKVCYKNHCFNVEIAKTQQELASGLMFRKTLDENNGILFVFEKEGRYSFWMKNTLISLDIIWMNKDNKVIFIENSAQPCALKDCPSIDPGVNASYVLEISAGMAEKLGLKKGDELKISP